MEKQKNLYLGYVDFEKAFATVRHEEMTRMLKVFGVDGKDITLIVNPYWDHKAAVRLENGITKWVRNERGVKQGCVLHPNTFSLYSQGVTDEIGELEGV